VVGNEFTPTSRLCGEVPNGDEAISTIGGLAGAPNYCEGIPMERITIKRMQATAIQKWSRKKGKSFRC
jgi:hypothetical protein